MRALAHAMPTTDNRTYYDAFAESYDNRRDRGYHAMLDEQSAAIVARVGRGKSVLEVGCGTGLVLSRVAAFAASAEGVDLSPGMLERARARGLKVREGDVTALPYPDHSFDVAYSFKVLAHVEAIDQAMGELVRVVRPGGHVIVDLYNRRSLRYLAKRVGGWRPTSRRFDEGAIFTRWEEPDDFRRRLPPQLRIIDQVGLRVITPHARLHDVPWVGGAVERLEWMLMRGATSQLGGFVIYAMERR